MTEALIALGIVAFLVLLYDAIVRPDDRTPPDCDSLTSNDAKCEAVRLKQAAARARMKKLGIRSLLDGRPAWQRINPMHSPQPESKVIRMKRR